MSLYTQTRFKPTYLYRIKWNRNPYTDFSVVVFNTHEEDNSLLCKILKVSLTQEKK